MSLLIPFLAAWLALRLALLGRQSNHLRRTAGAVSASHIQARLAANAVGVTVEAALLAWLLPGGGLAWSDALLTGLPAAVIALSLRAAIWQAVELYGAIIADARAGLAGRLNLGRYAGGLALQGAVAVGLLGGLAALLPDHWLLAWLAWSAVELGRGWLAPMLERGEPLADSDSVQRLQRLLQNCGLGDCRLLQTAGATASRRVNARFIGLPGARSILLTPTLLGALPPDQVAAVVGHEAGHCRHRHLEQWLTAKLALGLAGFAVLPLLFPMLPLSPAAVLAALWLMAGVLGYFLRPLPAALRRAWEFEADAFAARHVGAPAMIAALRRIDGANAAQPTADPLFAAFTAFHPSLVQRLARLAADQAATGAVAEDGAG
jgi:STE24 endopeptidase